MAIGHCDEPLLSVVDHHPATEGTRCDCPSEADDDVERVFDILELEREPRRRLQPGIRHNFARASGEYVLSDVLHLLQDVLNASGVPPPPA